jgi:hypothetical protein
MSVGSTELIAEVPALPVLERKQSVGWTERKRSAGLTEQQVAGLSKVDL